MEIVAVKEIFIRGEKQRLSSCRTENSEQGQVEEQKDQMSIRRA